LAGACTVTRQCLVVTERGNAFEMMGIRMGGRLRRHGLVVAGVVLALTVAACSSSSKSSSTNTTAAGGGSGSATTTSGGGAPAGNKASAPGVKADSIKVGLITSLSGSDSSNSVTIPKGFAARIAAQNAAGGVNGRKITYITEDDQSSPAQAATAAQAAVNAGAFAIDYNSPFTFGAIRYMSQAGVPVVGGAYDGPEWSEVQQFPNMFSWTPVLYPSYPVYSTDAQFIKGQAGTRVASVGYGVSPSSSATAKGMEPAAKSVGIEAPYINSSLPFGTVNVTAVALAMKAANVDSLYGPIDPNTLLALISAAQQTGVNLKVADMSTGYGEDFLSDPSSLKAGQNAYMVTNSQVPVELKTPATMTEQAAFAKYQGFTGVPNFGWTEGYASADLLIKGLEVAGQNPTRSSFIDNLRKVTSYNVDNLATNTVNFSNIGTIPNQTCSYYVQLKGNQFMVQNNNKPVCGNLVKS
jgi:branched-chain amino acid transport system substrate-binding protein